jgi:hypothetical protein
MFEVVRSVVSLLAKGSCADSTVRNWLDLLHFRADV